MPPTTESRPAADLFDGQPVSPQKARYLANEMFRVVRSNGSPAEVLRDLAVLVGVSCNYLIAYADLLEGERR